LQEYEAQTVPLVDYYRRQGRLHELNGELAPERVTADALAVIEQAIVAGRQ
jgi:adenylate kinase family enzyme